MKFGSTFYFKIRSIANEQTESQTESCQHPVPYHNIDSQLFLQEYLYKLGINLYLNNVVGKFCRFFTHATRAFMRPLPCAADPSFSSPSATSTFLFFPFHYFPLCPLFGKRRIPPISSQLLRKSAPRTCFNMFGSLMFESYARKNIASIYYNG